MRIAEDTFRGVIREMLREELEDVWFYVDRLPDGGFELRFARGEGRAIKVARVVVTGMRLESAGRDRMGQLLYDLAHDCRIAMWGWNRPGGVARFGKLRLFKRSAAIAVKAAA